MCVWGINFDFASMIFCNESAINWWKIRNPLYNTWIPSFSSCFDQVWHILFPNILFKIEEICWPEENFHLWIFEILELFRQCGIFFIFFILLSKMGQSQEYVLQIKLLTFDNEKREGVSKNIINCFLKTGCSRSLNICSIQINI